MLGFVKQPRIMELPERIARRHIAGRSPTPRCGRSVTPGYTIGCKRILPSNQWYPALAQPNVELLTDGVAG